MTFGEDQRTHVSLSSYIISLLAILRRVKRCVMAVAVSEVMSIYVITDRTCIIGVRCSHCSGKIIKDAGRDLSRRLNLKSCKENGVKCSNEGLLQ